MGLLHPPAWLRGRPSWPSIGGRLTMPPAAAAAASFLENEPSRLGGSFFVNEFSRLPGVGVVAPDPAPDAVPSRVARRPKEAPAVGEREPAGEPGLLYSLLAVRLVFTVRLGLPPLLGSSPSCAGRARTE